MNRPGAMTHSKEASISFYQLLGKVFYAVAAADQRVRSEELEVLRTIIRSEWLDVDQARDEFGTDSAFQIEVVFDWLDDQKMNASSILSSLQAFKSDHPSFFTKQVNDLILKTAKAISSSFHGNNKSELVVLSNLEAVLAK
ncbi:MAG: hypothetical protein ACO1NS_11350 [Daejeonella sp.]|uniref:hypothetical protein n=1 Tax=Daejeonella sp. JGW-45 TaxID=3034148 RepID=UPI0023EAC699|nr:hypothetical protein [Daejeonella sp. JGW-45]